MGPAQELVLAFPYYLQLLLTVVNLVQVSKAEVMDLGKSLGPRFQCQQLPAAVPCLSPSIPRQMCVCLPWLPAGGESLSFPKDVGQSSTVTLGQICPPCSPEAICFTICEHKEKMK